MISSSQNLSLSKQQNDESGDNETWAIATAFQMPGEKFWRMPPIGICSASLFAWLTFENFAGDTLQTATASVPEWNPRILQAFVSCVSKI